MGRSNLKLPNYLIFNYLIILGAVRLAHRPQSEIWNLKLEIFSMEQPTYTQAAERLEQIVQQIEAGTLSLDDLSAKVKEATELVKICKKRL